MTGPAGRSIALMGIVMGFLLLLFGGGVWAGIYSSDIRLALVLAGGVGSAVWLLVALVRPRWLPRSALTGAFAASLLAFAICEAVAWQPRLGFDYLGYAILLTALYLLLVRIWAEPYFARFLGWLLVGLTFAIGAAYVVVIFSLWIDFWRGLGHFAVPPLRPGYEGLWLGNPNALASLLVLLFLVSAAAVGSRNVRQRIVTASLGALVAFDVLLTGSRGSWLGLVIAVVVGIAVWLAPRNHRARLRATLSMRRVQLGASVMVLAALAVGAVLAPAIASRIGDPAADTRTSFWAASVRMIEDRPLTGLGPGAWAPARLVYSVSSDTDYYIPHAHNVPLQVAAEFGAVGIAAAVVVVAMVLRLVVRGLRSPDPQARSYAWATLLATVYLSGQQMVDAYIHQPAILLALALPIAQLDSRLTTVTAGESTRGPRSRVLAGTLLAAVLVATVAGAYVEGAAKVEEQAASAANSGQWALALSDARRAELADPDLAPYSFLLGLAAAREGDLDAARDAFARAAALDDLPASWLDLAAVEARLGDRAAERDALRRALRMGDQQPAIAVAGAAMLLELGDGPAARTALAAAFRVAPSLASDPAFDVGAWPAIADLARSDAQQALGDTFDGYMLALERGDTNLAAAIASRLPASRARDATNGAAAWSGDFGAFALLRARAEAQSLDGTVIALCRRVAQVVRARTGDLLAWTCDSAGWTAPYPVVRIGPPFDHQVMPGPAAYWHSQYAFRRFGPKDPYVPWIVQLQSTIP